MSESGDRSSVTRKRALRILMREQYADYTLLYEEIRPATQTRHQARSRAWTRLRARFPDRYLELYAQEQAGLRTGVPATSGASPGSGHSPGWLTCVPPRTENCSPGSGPLA